jgi:hypothetical protein
MSLKDLNEIDVRLNIVYFLEIYFAIFVVFQYEK